MMELLFKDGTRIEIFSGSTRITLADGATILGCPEDSDSYRHTALECGYGTDTVSLCIEHELLHVALADWLQTTSPTMEMVGKLIHNSPLCRQLEEDVILAMQKYVRALNIDLMRLFSPLSVPDK